MLALLNALNVRVERAEERYTHMEREREKEKEKERERECESLP
jgi:hypothetical protein